MTDLSTIDRASVLRFCEDELRRRIKDDSNYAGYWRCKLKICQHFSGRIQDQIRRGQPTPLTDQDRSWLISNHHFLQYPEAPSPTRFTLPDNKRDAIKRAVGRLERNRRFRYKVT